MRALNTFLILIGLSVSVSAFGAMDTAKYLQQQVYASSNQTVKAIYLLSSTETNQGWLSGWDHYDQRYAIETVEGAVLFVNLGLRVMDKEVSSESGHAKVRDFLTFNATPAASNASYSKLSPVKLTEAIPLALKAASQMKGSSKIEALYLQIHDYEGIGPDRDRYSVKYLAVMKDKSLQQLTVNYEFNRVYSVNVLIAASLSAPVRGDTTTCKQDLTTLSTGQSQ